MARSQIWKPEQYDSHMSFNTVYGKDVISLLAPKEGERILDLGCGTGTLTSEIAAAGAQVTGMDNSAEMLQQARANYPNIPFIKGNAEQFQTSIRYDAVFSNAALHWVQDASGALHSIYGALEPGGRFVAEFGGKGNIEEIYQAIKTVLADDYGIDADSRNPWYYPSPGEYAAQLEMAGFRVNALFYFDRPTKLVGGEEGILVWLKQFGDSFFTDFSVKERHQAFQRISEIAKTHLWHADSYYGDYKRLRIAAVKPH
ncbi:class I SAM-dependent methyltransferase [Paenibacillus campinasensis]|uniref:SAM-dependent methyltransferase n=1 Tax=Paenibacillus campinasensis TaxID=66347 RepID=A0A268EKR1_9BACL|nr:class I SAM-dependent methyltransferase [Paenibacillus campinasensis]PAD73716.1 SAM-dependent methyltransferase [Paenibacillus campinasensis]